MEKITDLTDASMKGMDAFRICLKYNENAEHARGSGVENPKELAAMHALVDIGIAAAGTLVAVTPVAWVGWCFLTWQLKRIKNDVFEEQCLRASQGR